MYPQKTLFNPFTRIAGFSALYYGCLFMLLTAVIAAPCGVNFVGSLNIHVAQPMPFALIFSWLVVGWLNAAVFFHAAGLIFSKSTIRTVDVFGTLALARAPFLIAAPFGLLPGLWDFDPQALQAGQIPPEAAVSLNIATIVFLLVDVCVVVWSYGAFAVSTNVKSKWLFAAVLLASETAAVALAGVVADKIPLNILVENSVVQIDFSEVPLPEGTERTEHIDIAQKFIERIFANTDDNPLEQFQVADVMRKLVTARILKQWSKGIIIKHGKIGDYAGLEVVQHNEHSRSVYFYFHCERRPVKMWVTFDDTLVSGFHFGLWE